jgi:hypothetical protein
MKPVEFDTSAFEDLAWWIQKEWCVTAEQSLGNGIQR